ncbi:hypothetical protein HOK51_03935 [Candidatus Woesearchaeota archaeon]|mgnify:CR=1 FL=1|nr:hypothetical protein [Candidatus Woesearchaeota archaeon]MBT6518973.1 hypothetical protein [Candidatus Woesearchaeota archaeon]MBT7368338.1 hypothetical protein [Candidatus Woesearchaeota archaeon]
MTQNRNKLIELFIGNLANSVIHKILETAIDNTEISNKYEKELKNSFEIAKKYRDKINPLYVPFPDKDVEYIRIKLTNKVNSELLKRISRGYENIDLKLVKEFIDQYLKILVVI